MKTQKTFSAVQTAALAAAGVKKSDSQPVKSQASSSLKKSAQSHQKDSFERTRGRSPTVRECIWNKMSFTNGATVQHIEHKP